MTTNPMKNLALKVIMFQDDKFAVIRGQRSHADVYQKKYMSQLRGPKKTVDFKKHPNAMSKWAKMRQLLSDHKKIKKIEGNLFKCVNDYDLFTLMKDLHWGKLHTLNTNLPKFWMPVVKPAPHLTISSMSAIRIFVRKSFFKSIICKLKAKAGHL